MRRFALVLALLAVSVLARPSAEAQDGAEQVDSNAPPTVTTEVAGEIPVDLRGVWLIVGNGQILKNPGKFRNSIDIEAIRKTDGKLDMQPVLVELPPDIQTQFDQANKQLQAWQPSPEQTEQLSRSLEQLKPVDPMRYYRHTAKIVGPGGYQEALKPELIDFVKEGAFAMAIEHVFRPQPITPDARGVQLMNDDAIYSIQKTAPTVLEGEHSRTILAAGFLPIPVATAGSFTMRRLRGPEAMPAAPARSLSDRVTGFLGGLFRGCR
jgi:hypothetical protein